MSKVELQDSGQVYVAAHWVDRKAVQACVSELNCLFDDKCEEAGRLAKRGEFEKATKLMTEAVGIMTAVNFLRGKIR